MFRPLVAGILALGLVHSLPSGTVAASLQSVADCEKFAAYVWEPGHKDTGVKWNAVSIADALPACTLAHSEAPDDVATQFRLGRTLLQARQTEQALQLLRGAAEKGYPPAQSAYGTELMRGKVIPQDFPSAFEWLTRAAEAGDPVGKANLGLMYDGSYGIEPDAEMYVGLQLSAAEEGVDFAQSNVGGIFQSGLGVPSDLAPAEKWYRLAAEQGHARGQTQLGVLLRDNATDASDYEEAFHWLEKAAAQDYVTAENELAWMYVHGQGTDQNLDLAREKFERAYGLGSTESARLLGYMYRDGKGVPQDHQRALSYFIPAAWFGNDVAQLELGYYFREGLAEVPQSKAIALEWFLRSAAQGMVDAQVSAADLFSPLRADNPLADLESSIYWYEIAFYSGRLSAGIELALLHTVAEDYLKAQGYIDYLKENGDEELIEMARHAQEDMRLIVEGLYVLS